MIAVVTDPWFYAAAVPAVLLMGLSKSGFASGFGALAIPIMALVVPVPQAAAIMLPLLLIMDGTGLQTLWRHRDRAMLRRLLPAGLVGTVVGTVLFGRVTPAALAGVVGALTLLFLAQRLLFPPRAAARPSSNNAPPPGNAAPQSGNAAPPPRRAVGFACAVASGFTSFVAHAGGPPMNAYLLPLRMPPLVYAGTMAVFFAAINASKWIPYAWLGLIDLRNMATALVLAPFAPLGVWLGVHLTRRIRPDGFYRLAYTGMFLTGVKLLWDGLR